MSLKTWAKLVNLKLDLLIEKVDSLQRRIDLMSPEFQRLRESVANQTTVINSAVTLMNGLTAALRELASKSPTADDINALADQIERDVQDLGRAVAENTPAESP